MAGKERSLISLAMVLVTALIISSCVPRAIPALEITPAPVAAPSSKAEWEEKWGEVLARAKKEGELVIYSSTITPETGGRRLGEMLKQEYGINVELFSAPGSQFAEKISRERLAGIYSVDIIITGAYQTHMVLKPKGFLKPLDDTIVLPEVLGKQVWVNGEFPWGDQEHSYLDFGGLVSYGIARNTELVRRDEITSYQDLLNPKWKRKIVFGDPTVSGAAGYWFRLYYGLGVLGEEYLKALIEQEPVIADKRLQLEWLARGKYPIALGPSMWDILGFKNLGAPIDFVPTKEVGFLSAGGGFVSIYDHASNPNAASLFVNWILTRRGQTAWSEGLSLPSRRIDVPTTHLHPASIPKVGAVYLKDTPETMDRSTEYYILAKQIFAPLLIGK